MVKIHSLAQFPVDEFFHPVVPSPLLNLYSFSAFAYKEINRFIFSPNNLHVGIINFCFHIIGQYGIVLGWY